MDHVSCYYGKTFDEHLRNLRMVLRICKQHKVKLRTKKCSFVKNEVTYLGKIISESYKDNTIEVEANEKLKQKTRNVGDLNKLLSFIGYYTTSICDFPKKVKPLYFYF